MRLVICALAVILMAAAPSPKSTPPAPIDVLLSSHAKRRIRLLLQLRLLDLRRAGLTCAEAVVRRRLDSKQQLDLLQLCDYSQKRE